MNINNKSDILGALYKTLAFTGHRPKDLPAQFGYNYNSEGWQNVIDKISNSIKYFNTNKVISGAAQGLDTAAALAALRLKDEGYPVQLQIESPFKGQELQWSPEAQSLYNSILNKADVVNYISDNYTGNYLYQQRNENMVNQADALVALWNGTSHGGTFNTIKYADKVGKPIINIYDSIMKNFK